jgi:hypothetical protein
MYGFTSFCLVLSVLLLSTLLNSSSNPSILAQSRQPKQSRQLDIVNSQMMMIKIYEHELRRLGIEIMDSGDAARKIRVELRSISYRGSRG